MAAFRSTKYVSILGQPFLKWQVYASVAAVVLVVCGVIGALYYVMLQNRGASSEPAVAEALPAETLVPEKRGTAVRVLPEGYRTLSPLSQLLENHIRVTRLDEVGNYIARGTFGHLTDVSEGGVPMSEIVLMARAPDLYKFKTKYAVSGAVIEFGYDGEVVWLSDSQSWFGDNVEMRNFFASIAVLEASLAHLAWSYRSPAAQEYGLDSVLKLLAVEEWDGRECAVVQSYGLLPLTVYHYVDTSTYREVHRRAQFVNEDGDIVEVSINYYSSDEEATYGLPMGYQIFIDGKLHDTVRYANVRFNQAIMSAIFAPSRGSSIADLGVR